MAKVNKDWLAGIKDFYHLSLGFKSLLNTQHEALHELRERYESYDSSLHLEMFYKNEKELLAILSKSQEFMEGYKDRHPFLYKLFKKRCLKLVDNIDNHIGEVLYIVKLREAKGSIKIEQ